METLLAKRAFHVGHSVCGRLGKPALADGTADGERAPARDLCEPQIHGRQSGFQTHLSRQLLRAVRLRSRTSDQRTEALDGFRGPRRRRAQRDIYPQVVFYKPSRATSNQHPVCAIADGDEGLSRIWWRSFGRARQWAHMVIVLTLRLVRRLAWDPCTRADGDF